MAMHRDSHLTTGGVEPAGSVDAESIQRVLSDAEFANHLEHVRDHVASAVRRGKNPDWNACMFAFTLGDEAPVMNLVYFGDFDKSMTKHGIPALGHAMANKGDYVLCAFMAVEAWMRTSPLESIQAEREAGITIPAGEADDRVEVIGIVGLTLDRRMAGGMHEFVRDADGNIAELGPELLTWPVMPAGDEPGIHHLHMLKTFFQGYECGWALRLMSASGHAARA